ncbi:MAG: hypothetical protein ABIH42_09595, partial [Planctomycetota bacterium]
MGNYFSIKAIIVLIWGAFVSAAGYSIIEFTPQDDSTSSKIACFINKETENASLQSDVTQNIPLVILLQEKIHSKPNINLNPQLPESALNRRGLYILLAKSPLRGKSEILASFLKSEKDASLQELLVTLIKSDCEAAVEALKYA